MGVGSSRKIGMGVHNVIVAGQMRMYAKGVSAIKICEKQKQHPRGVFNYYFFHFSGRKITQKSSIFCLICNKTSNTMSFIISILAALGLYGSGGEDIVTLSPKAFYEAYTNDSTAVVIDVRRPDEYAEGHIENAIPLNYLDKEEFDKGVSRLSLAPTYYLYCRSGRRSHEAAVKLKQKGYKVIDMRGGMLEWQKQKLPVTRKKE